jgi:hypothetical protein
MAVPFWDIFPRSWGFWFQGCWIGPRHTNFPDGSICCFNFGDGTWFVGESLVALLDMNTVWAIRHLHLRFFGRWPGRQVAHYPYERTLELHDDELCGCGSSNRYAECCKPADSKCDQVREAVSFAMMGPLRSPPDAVRQFLTGAAPTPPDIRTTLT